MRWTAVLATLALAAGSVRAGPVESANDKSLGVAFGLSLGGTALGVAATGLALTMSPEQRRGTLIAAGASAAMFMPSVGHWYARGNVVWTAGAYTRLAGACIALTGAVMAIGRDDEVGGVPHVPLGVIYTGLGLLAGGILLDIALVPSTVRRANRRPNKAIELGLLAPSVGAGVAIFGKF